jgi:hypothetical protein
MRYEKYRYIYPPRPKNAIPDHEISQFESTWSMIAQPKLNGSNCVIFTDGERQIVMNRHNQRLTNFRLTESEIKGIYHGEGWMVINGEYMNKNKMDENRQLFNHKFVIFDILTFNGEYLVGKTFEERVKLLDELYGQVESEKDYLYKISDNIYRVKSYNTGFRALFDKLTQIDMVEGLVMKRKNARLELGTSELNNAKNQLKCRKPTKNYKF